MFCPNSSSAKAERSTVASVTSTSAAYQVMVSLPVPVEVLVIVIEVVEEVYPVEVTLPSVATAATDSEVPAACSAAEVLETWTFSLRKRS